jgi:putative ABC transport system substrate-binding protein
MERRKFIRLIGISVVAWPAPGWAQERVYRVAHLSETAEAEGATRAFSLPALAEMGFVEGRNLHLSMRAGAADDLPTLAKELLATKPDVVIAIGSAAALAAREATKSVPIVLFSHDPVALGLATSFARPGSNVTGISTMVVELQEKRLELLLEAVPKLRRVAVLLRVTSPTREQSARTLPSAAARAGIELLVYSADGPSDYPAAFAAMRRDGVEALLIGSDPRFFQDRDLLVALSREYPTSCEWVSMARAGCLLGYGASRPELRRRLGQYVARILSGASAGELPIEQPSKFELGINLKTAKALNLNIPRELLARSDEVID